MTDYSYFWVNSKLLTVKKRKVQNTPDVFCNDVIALDYSTTVILSFKYLYYDDKYANTNSILLPTNMVGKDVRLRKIMLDFMEKIKEAPFYFLRHEEAKMGKS